jgi:hypothetical protein
MSYGRAQARSAQQPAHHTSVATRRMLAAPNPGADGCQHCGCQTAKTHRWLRVAGVLATENTVGADRAERMSYQIKAWQNSCPHPQLMLLALHKETRHAERQGLLRSATCSNRRARTSKACTTTPFSLFNTHTKKTMQPPHPKRARPKSPGSKVPPGCSRRIAKDITPRAATPPQHKVTADEPAAKCVARTVHATAVWREATHHLFLQGALTAAACAYATACN